MLPIKVTQIHSGFLVREGAGVKLKRYIGASPTNDLEPLLLLDYFDSCDPLDYIAGFPAHPHRGFETITYLLHGTITHSDNHGHQGVIHAGDVQWMTAGRGIIHSEMPTLSARLQGIQLWLNVPAAEKMVRPRYQDIASSQLPLEQYKSGVVIKVIAGVTANGLASPISAVSTKPLFFDLTIPKDQNINYPVPDDYQAIILVITGKIAIAERQVIAQQMAVLSAGDKLAITGLEDSHCLFIAAKKLHEPIVRHGPFVMNTYAEIKQAMADLQNGTF